MYTEKSVSYTHLFWFNWVCYVPSEAIAVATVLTSLMGTDSAVTLSLIHILAIRLRTSTVMPYMAVYMQNPLILIIYGFPDIVTMAASQEAAIKK